MPGCSLERTPLAQFLQLKMAHRYFQAVLTAQTFRQLLGEEHGAMLAAGAAERVHQRQDTGEKLVHGLLLIEVVDDRSVLAGERLEALFAAGIGEAAAIENEAPAVAAFVLGQAAVK